jgi:hypothetical protein
MGQSLSVADSTSMGQSTAGDKTGHKQTVAVPNDETLLALELIYKAQSKQDHYTRHG